MSDFRALDEFLSSHVQHGPAGCGCIVTKDGEFIYENYFGYANLENKIPITKDSLYRQFSNTKVVVCTAMMMQYERGKFLLQDPIYEYFPEWKDTMVAEEKEDGEIVIRPVNRPIQIQDCLTMAMGIGYDGDNYTQQMANQVRQELADTIGPNYTLRDDIRAMSQVPVRFDPGTHWLYGFGHELVAGIIEETSGMTIGEFLKKEIFEPLGMDSTGYQWFGDTRERMVTPYIRHEDGTMEPTTGFLDPLHEPDAKYQGGGGGLFSSVRDYGVFTAMLANGGTYKGTRIVGRKTIDFMRTNRLNAAQLEDFQSSYRAGYGYGLGLRTLIDPARGTMSSIGEFGWDGFMGSYVAIDPSEHVSVVYMQNAMPPREEFVHHRISNIVFGALD